LLRDIWVERKVGVIVETHSANLVLRLRHLVRRGKLKPEDVSIAYFYFDNVEKSVQVKNLDIAENGNLSKGLPREFFAADLLEVMEMESAHD